MSTKIFARLGRLALSILVFFSFIALNTGAAAALPLLQTTAPANDLIGNATVIGSFPYNDSSITDITTATPGPLDTSTDPAMPNCTNGTGAFTALYTVWYTYTTPASTYGDLELDTIGSGFDTVLAVWTGTTSSLTPVACNDDFNGTQQSHLDVLVQPSTQYFIEVGQFSSSDKVVNASSTTNLVFNAQFTAMSPVSCTLYKYSNYTPLANNSYYDDRCTNIVYDGNWSATGLTVNLRSTLYQSNNTGDASMFYFTGTRFALLGGTTSAGGNMDVYVDNLFYATINEYSNSSTWQEFEWSSPILLTNTLHAVTLVNHGNGKVYLDGFRIVTPTVTTPPDAITDLNAIAGTSPGTVNLTWTAPKDYDSNGNTVESYQVRYSTFPITNEAYWSFASVVVLGIPTPPDAPGTTETMTVTGLVPGPTYYFAVRSMDTEPNLSPLSNAPSSTPIAPTPEGIGIYDDPDPSWIYTGVWFARVNYTGPYNRTEHYTSDPSAVATFVFTGNQFIFKYVKASNRGQIRVTLDGSVLTTINAYNCCIVWQAAYTSPILNSTTHTVQFSYAGPRGKYIDVDSLQILVVSVPIDDAAPAWSYAPTGAWYARTNYTGPYLKTEHYTNISGASATISINGSQFSFKYVKASNRGTILILVDGAQLASINAYNCCLVWQAVYTSPVLSGPPNHTIQFVNASSGSQFIDVDSIQVLNPYFDDANTFNPWTYSPSASWTARAGISGPYNKTEHYTNTNGASASITISGSQFTFLYVKSTNRCNNIQVLLDGSPIDTINAYYGTTVWQAQYNSPPLTSGVHTVTIQNMCTNNTYLDVDAVQVFP